MAVQLSPLGKAANALASRYKWKVFPCRPRDKRPLIDAWQRQGTSDTRQIFDWWQRWPDANIGVVCGHASGIVVVDIDPTHHGFDTWNDLVDIQGAVETLESFTGSGGQHIIFEAPETPLRSRVGTFGPGIDTRAEGGYIIAPPSVHPNGTAYEWATKRPPSPLPEWLLERWPRAEQQAAGPSQGQPNWVALALASGAPEGERNSTATRLVGYFHNAGTPGPVIAVILADWANKCSPPMTQDELSQVINSVTTRYKQGSNDSFDIYELTYDWVSDVPPEPVRWLWPQHFAKGKLSLVAGDPGLAKSYLTCDLAARISLGSQWPDSQPCEQGAVVMISAEDDPNDTIRPRLDTLGADIGRIIVSTGEMKGTESTSVFQLDQHLTQLEALIINTQPAAVIIDPILAFTGRLNTHRSAEVRQLLHPLAAMAARNHVAIIAIIHLNKNSSNANSMYRVTASLDFVGAARSVFVCGRHPEDDLRFIFASVKQNLCKPPPSQEYGFTIDGHFRWVGEIDISADTLLQPRSKEDQEDRRDAINILSTALQEGPRASKEMEEIIKQHGLSMRAVSKAKKDLGIVPTPHNEPGKRGAGQWYWYMPEHHKTEY